MNEGGNVEELKENNLGTECQDNSSRELKDAIAGLVPTCKDDSSDVPRDTSSYKDTEHRDYRNGKVEDTQVGVDSECHVETSELKDISGDLHTSVK